MSSSPPPGAGTTGPPQNLQNPTEDEHKLSSFRALVCGGPDNSGNYDVDRERDCFQRAPLARSFFKNGNSLILTLQHSRAWYLRNAPVARYPALYDAEHPLASSTPKKAASRAGDIPPVPLYSQVVPVLQEHAVFFFVFTVVAFVICFAFQLGVLLLWRGSRGWSRRKGADKNICPLVSDQLQTIFLQTRYRRPVTGDQLQTSYRSVTDQFLQIRHRSDTSGIRNIFSASGIRNIFLAGFELPRGIY